MKARAGFEIDVVGNDASGQLDLGAIERGQSKLSWSPSGPSQSSLAPWSIAPAPTAYSVSGDTASPFTVL